MQIHVREIQQQQQKACGFKEKPKGLYIKDQPSNSQRGMANKIKSHLSKDARLITLTNGLVHNPKNWLAYIRHP